MGGRVGERKCQVQKRKRRKKMMVSMDSASGDNKGLQTQGKGKKSHGKTPTPATNQQQKTNTGFAARLQRKGGKIQQTTVKPATHRGVGPPGECNFYYKNKKVTVGCRGERTTQNQSLQEAQTESKRSVLGTGPLGTKKKGELRGPKECGESNSAQIQKTIRNRCVKGGVRKKGGNRLGGRAHLKWGM